MDFIDEYEHKNPQVIYFPQSIPTKEIEETIVENNVCCNCEELCTEHSNCVCIEKSGTFYSYSVLNDLGNYTLTYKDPNKPTFECNERCTCKNILCGNKLAQCGPRKNLEIKICKEYKKGGGLFTGYPIKSGNFICEYAGEIISEQQASLRYKSNTELNKMNYIFCINEHFGENNIRTFIDPTFYGNIGRYVNHSCEPNCAMLIIRINTNIPILGLFACKDIHVDEELTYDYGSVLSNKSNEDESSRTKCLCGSRLCSGFLPFDTRIM